MAEFERTCWRGLEVDHPAHWEVAVASGPKQDHRLVLADRYHHRLDVRWKHLDYNPQLERVMDRYRQHEGGSVEFQPIDSLSEGWLGVLQPLEPKGALAHLGKFFAARGVLVEATVFWPGKRDVNLERVLAEGISPQDPAPPQRTWQAMGMSLDIDKRYDLTEADLKVGRLRWTFASGAKGDAELVVERIALAEQWLDEPLREWLVRELPGEFTPLRQDAMELPAHRGERVTSQAKMYFHHTLRGIRRLRVDQAWLCPLESRVYRMTASLPSREQALDFPAHVSVRCCRRPPLVGASEG
ncbi:MAG: hypothetical protein LLG01_13625 [Planctomycetaceae bacterium]|nr:hypothetical protein [Planctomycetaceae bacterium]